nr:MAG TPA_asm: hypothetical protein [Caudoviricetes sp.]
MTWRKSEVIISPTRFSLCPRAIQLILKRAKSLIL